MKTHVLDILDTLASQKGKGSQARKAEILEKNRDNVELQNFFRFCLDPQINYYQTKIDHKIKYLPVDDEVATLEDAMTVIMKKLASREVTGNRAKGLLKYIHGCLGEKDQELLKRIITRKPKVGFNVSTVNSIWPKLILDPAYQRCEDYDPKHVKKWDFENDYVVSQLKKDGQFSYTIYKENEGGTTFLTRSFEDISDGIKVSTCNSEFPVRLGCVYRRLVDLGVKDPVLCGEFEVYKDGEAIERSKGNGMINHIKQGGELEEGYELVLTVWDYLPFENLDDHIEYDVPYEEKFNNLIDIFADFDEGPLRLVEHKFISSIEEAFEHFKDVLKRGLEGTVLKHGNLTWKYHTSKLQLKMKNKFTFEMMVVDYIDGKDKFEGTIGSIVVQSACGQLTTSVSGMTDKIREMINSDREGYLNSIVEVEASGLFLNDDGSYAVMHPRFVEVRKDRRTADLLVRIIKQEKTAIMGENNAN